MQIQSVNGKNIKLINKQYLYFIVIETNLFRIRFVYFLYSKTVGHHGHEKLDYTGVFIFYYVDNNPR